MIISRSDYDKVENELFMKLAQTNVYEYKAIIEYLAAVHARQQWVEANML